MLYSISCYFSSDPDLFVESIRFFVSLKQPLELVTRYLITSYFWGAFLRVFVSHQQRCHVIAWVFATWISIICIALSERRFSCWYGRVLGCPCSCQDIFGKSLPSGEQPLVIDSEIWTLRTKDEMKFVQSRFLAYLLKERCPERVTLTCSVVSLKTRFSKNCFLFVPML